MQKWMSFCEKLSVECIYAEMDGKFYDDKDLFREDYYELKGKFLKGKYSDTKSLYILLDQIAKKFFKKAIFLYVNIFM